MAFNIEEYTLGELRRISHAIDLAINPPPVTVATGPSADIGPGLGADRIGKVVLVRSRGSGVWVGRLVSRMTTAAGHSVQLADARRLWSWQGAGECSSLALTGPSDGKIGPPSAPIVHEVLEEHEVTTEAAAAVSKIKVWTR